MSSDRLLNAKIILIALFTGAILFLCSLSSDKIGWYDSGTVDNSSLGSQHEEACYGRYYGEALTSINFIEATLTPSSGGGASSGRQHSRYSSGSGYALSCMIGFAQTPYAPERIVDCRILDEFRLLRSREYYTIALRCIII